MVLAKIWMPDEAHHSKSVNVELNDTVKKVTQLISEMVNISPESLNIYYLGRKLPSDQRLSDCSGLEENHQLFVMKNTESTLNPLVGAEPNEADVESLAMSFTAAWTDQIHRNLLLKVMSNRETINNLISTTPGLLNDSIAQRVLRDPYLLLNWLTDQNVLQKIKSDHRCIVDAGQQILSSLHAEAAVLGMGQNPLLLMDDDQDDSGDESGDDQAAAAAPQQAMMAGPRMPAAGITPQQLAAALAMATGGTTPRPQLNIPPPQPAPAEQPSGSQTPGTITTDMFRRAMEQVFPGANPQSQQQPSVNFESAMNELRAMDFNNEEENLRALRATNGNIERALEFIINEREQMNLD